MIFLLSWRLNSMDELQTFDNESVWCKLWLQNECKSQWLIFQGPEILSYILKPIWWMNIKLLDNESVWCKVWLENRCRSQWPIFYRPMILPYMLKTTWWMNVKLLNNVSVWLNINDLKMNVGHSDIHFMVQWFCPVSWRVLDGCMSATFG